MTPTPKSQKRVRAEQAELYVEGLGLKGACEAMGPGAWPENPPQGDRE